MDQILEELRMSKCMPNFNLKPEIGAFCNSSIAYFETPKQWFHNTFSDRFATCNKRCRPIS